MLEATFYQPAGPGPAPLAIFHHGSDVGRNQLKDLVILDRGALASQ
jgi:hypothetical protein